MIRKIIGLYGFVLLGIVLSSCGQQGPLYLPDKNVEQTTSSMN